jgi:hypothetical protein
LEAVGATDFLHGRVYGRSRVPSLTALLQRQFRPVPPLPLRRDALLISSPEMFEPSVRMLEELCHMREELEITRNAIRHVQERRAALLAAQQGQQRAERS